MLITLGFGLRPRQRAAWIPSTLDGLIGWYDAADPASLVLESGLVSQWSDKSPAGHHLLGAGDNKPHTGTVMQNTRNMVDFKDGAYAKYLSLSGSVTGGALSGLSSMASTLSFVFKQDAVNSAGAVVSIRNAAYADAFVPDLNNANRAYFPDDTGIGYMQFNPTIMPRGTAYCVTFVWAASGIKCYINGALQGTDNAAASNYIDRFVLGYRCSTGASWKGAIGEICVLDRAITDSERAKLEEYLLKKWGIA